MFEVMVWIVYGLCLGIFLLWCILPVKEFKEILASRRRAKERD